MSDDQSRDPGSLSRLLEELAQVPHEDLPDGVLSGLRPGAEVGRFIIEREIGRGGFGVVYAALDPELGRTVALKLLKPGSGLVRKGTDWLRREAEAVARLSHAHIVTLHDFGRAPGGAYLVFELLRGETLAARLTHGPLPLEEVVRVGLAVARALAHAHEAKVLHRDLKPANVFLCGDGAVKVLDFGIAHLFEKGGPSTGGTPAYMAPEQWREETGDARTDLFALGVLLHEMITGALPFGKGGVRPLGDRALGPPLPRGRAPSRLRRLVRALIQTDPSARPASTNRVVAELEAVETALRERRRPWRWVALASAVVAAASGAAFLLAPPREPPAGERITAAIADAENETGDHDLDRLADLLAVALGESRRVQVLSRERLLAAGRGSSVEGVLQVDARAGKLLAGLAGAHVLLRPSARREGSGYLLELTGEPPEGGRPLFTATARAARKAAVPEALDALVAEARRALRERGDDLKRSPVQLAALTTTDLAAFRDYVEGIDCVSRPSEAPGHTGAEACGAFFERALGHDPSFALAHYQLATLLATGGLAQPELKAHMDGALRSIARLSRRDAGVVLAWKAHLDGKDDEALAGYTQLLAEYPDDRHVTYLAGDLLFHKSDFAGAIPYFLKVLELDPAAEWPLDHLARALASTGRWRELRALVEQVDALPPTAARRRAAVRALVWLGEPEQAVARARQHLANGGGAPARYDLFGALIATGAYVEADKIAVELDAAGPRNPSVAFRRLQTLCAQGRFTDAKRLLHELSRVIDGLLPEELARIGSMVAAGEGNVRLLGEEAARAVRLKAREAGDALVLLALFGDPVRARELAAALPRGSMAEQQVEALAVWRRGDAGAAAAALTLLEQRDPWPEDGIAPSYLLAELNAATGRPEEVVAAVERFHRMWPRTIWRGWAWSRSLLLAARAEERLGRREEALAAVERLLAVLRRADEGLPLLRDARHLRERLAARRAAPSHAEAAARAAP
ncbi:MAG TPA: protein kinase [Anaeromyxobacteraceae bacterium]|nr:protein kinase [Anaeromyxobacteraceae bacterium]